MTINQLIQLLEAQKSLYGGETTVVLESDSPYLCQADFKEVKTGIHFYLLKKKQNCYSSKRIP